MTRIDGRAADELRETKFTRGFIGHVPGSVLVECGHTRVIVTATIEDRVPPFLVGSGQGWVSAEYAMLPGSTGSRKPRDGRRGGHIDGRTIEIQRLIGRALRSVVDTRRLGQRTIWLDCDVIQADGGTRTASITGAYVALYDAIRLLREKKAIKGDPLKNGLAAVSVGVVDGKPLLDLAYEEDSRAEGDFNFVLSHDLDIIEVQAAAEKRPIPKGLYAECFDLAQQGVKQLVTLQNMTLIKDDLLS